MEIRYQDLEATKNKIIKMYMKNPKRSISATFRNLHNNSNISFIGDYSILSTIINIITELGIKTTRFQINHAFNQSEELRSISKKLKIQLLNQLFKPINAQMKLTKNYPEVKENKKLINIINQKK